MRRAVMQWRPVAVPGVSVVSVVSVAVLAREIKWDEHGVPILCPYHGQREAKGQYTTSILPLGEA